MCRLLHRGRKLADDFVGYFGPFQGRFPYQLLQIGRPAIDFAWVMTVYLYHIAHKDPTQ